MANHRLILISTTAQGVTDFLRTVAQPKDVLRFIRHTRRPVTVGCWTVTEDQFGHQYKVYAWSKGRHDRRPLRFPKEDRNGD